MKNERDLALKRLEVMQERATSVFEAMISSMFPMAPMLFDSVRQDAPRAYAALRAVLEIHKLTGMICDVCRRTTRVPRCVPCPKG